MALWRVPLLRLGNCCRLLHRAKHIDYSRYPVLREEDLEEEFVKGHGPGGSGINTTSSCVWLKHIPSGVGVKCVQTRSQDQNRKLARKLMVEKLDSVMNGDMSVAAQMKRAEDRKRAEKERRMKKKEEMKKTWKEREGLT